MSDQPSLRAEIEEKLKQEQAQRDENVMQKLREARPTEERHEKTEQVSAPSMARSEITTLEQQLAFVRAARDAQQTQISIDKKYQKIQPGLKVVAAYLAQEWPHLSVKEIEQDLQLRQTSTADLKKLEEEFRDDMGEAYAVDVWERNDHNMPQDSAGTDATLRHDRGPTDAPSIFGGLQTVRLYQEGNRVGVILYSDRGNYTGSPANILEHFEKKLDEKLDNAKQKLVMENAPANRNENKATSPMPEFTNKSARAVDEEDEKHQQKKDTTPKLKPAKSSPL